MPYLKMLWTTESPTPQIGSWDYWCSTANTILFNCGWNCTKVNNKIAYYGMYYTSETPFGRSATPILMSPDADAVTYDTGGAVRSYSGTITDINGITWYYSGLQGFASQHPVPDCIISDEVYSSIHDAAQALLDRIYAVPFHEDYQAGQYVLNRADKGRTVRKVLGLWLAFTVSNYSSPNVQYISDNADTIINDIVTKLSASTDFKIYMYARYNNVGRGVYINVYYGNNVSGITASIIQKSIYRGLEYYNIGATTPQSPFTNLYSLYVNYGTPTTTETTGTYYFQTIGIYSTNLYDKDITNMGIDL